MISLAPEVPFCIEVTGNIHEMNCSRNYIRIVTWVHNGNIGSTMVLRSIYEPRFQDNQPWLHGRNHFPY